MKSEYPSKPDTSPALTRVLECRQLPELKTDLGEGLVWDAQRERLLMTDILNGRLLDIDIDTATVRSWQFDEPLAWVLKTADTGVYLLGLRSGIACFDTVRHDHLHWMNQDFPGHAGLRLNDACVDARGKVWYGSMNSDLPSATDGQLASFSSQEGVRIHDRHFTVTNGPVVSADGQHLYLNDTLKGTVYRYRMSPNGDAVSDRQVFAQFDLAHGHPDGMCFDSNGHLWIALWGSASLVQLDPNGRVLRYVPVPAKNVTNVCFCGPRLDRLLVSTARIDMSPEEHRQYPLAGALFEVLNHGCIGLPTHSATLDLTWT